jgi:hypothetical protein
MVNHRRSHIHSGVFRRGRIDFAFGDYHGDGGSGDMRSPGAELDARRCYLFRERTAHGCRRGEDRNGSAQHFDRGSHLRQRELHLPSQWRVERAQLADLRKEALGRGGHFP